MKNRLVIEPEMSYTPWTPCSKSCGGGLSTRNESCSAQFDGINGTCDETNIESKLCNTEDCPRKTGEWREGEWTSCSATCGNATKQR